MTRKAVVRRSQAQKDIDDAADHYFPEGGAALEIRFIDALHAAVTRIAVNPGVGSPRNAVALSAWLTPQAGWTALEATTRKPWLLAEL